MQQLTSQPSGKPAIPEFAKLSAEIHNIIGTRCADEGNFSEALQNYNKAIELNPQDAAAFFNRGTIKVRFGDFTGARADFRNAHKLNVSKQVTN
jgi:Flp pilus assembly protein TadD